MPVLTGLLLTEGLCLPVLHRLASDRRSVLNSVHRFAGGRSVLSSVVRLASGRRSVLNSVHRFAGG